ncbi:MAG: xanthine dehydrogenase family protein molybdopterin-binding subunit [Actinomycetota bacterium]|jgi:aerobic carbon-monoxide dehydrogenase large subunit
MRESIVGRLVGASVGRVEDRRLLAGAGRYIDDVTVPGMLHAAFLRSPYPHAEITSIDAAQARALPGVHLVLTGEDIKRRTYPFFGLFAFEGLYQPSYWALAVDRVRHVGDPVAIVVADSRRLAEDACELIDVDFRPLPAVATPGQALDAGRALVWPKAKSNILYRASERFGEVDGAFAAADRIIVERFDQHRHSNQPMEARGIVAEIDPLTGGLTVHGTSQASHALKWSLALLTGRRPLRLAVRQILAQKERTGAIFTGIREYLKATPTLVDALREVAPGLVKQLLANPERTRAMNSAFTALIGKSPEAVPAVVTGDIGGAFGAKTLVHREDVAVCTAALELRRSIKWVEDRNEHLTTGAQAREESIEVAAAVRRDGEVLGMRARMTMDAGAYPGFPFGATLFARMVRTLFPGPYRLPALEFHTRVLASNKATYAAYRGPWAAETFVRERMLDVIARELGLSRADVRRRNMLRPDELPTRMVTGPTIDVRMSAARTLERALEVIDFDGWEKVRAAARAEGRRLGLGFATYIEPAPGPPDYLDHFAPGFRPMVNCEPIDAVLERDGTVTLATQQVPHGQGHETTLAQLAADELSLPLDSIRLRFGDTRRTPFGTVGTGGSRAATFASGAAVLASRELRTRIIDVAADLLEAAPDDLVIGSGRLHVKGTPAVAVSFADVANAAGEVIQVRKVFDGGEGGWAQSTHACIVEVALDTGQVRVLRYVVVEDCGDIINPAIVAGQIRGGVAQGIGAVLYEKSTYDDEGQFQAGTFMDYLLPTAMEIPDIEIHHLETPSDVFANYRGVGEGGMIGSPAAITNAIEDALADLGVRITEEHLPPARILELAGVIARRPGQG